MTLMNFTSALVNHGPLAVVRAIQIVNTRRDLAGRPFPHRPLEQPVVVSQLETEHLGNLAHRRASCFVPGAWLA